MIKEMTPEQFVEQYQCKFEVSQRDLRLYRHIENYLHDTDGAGFHVSANRAMELKAWADDNGYSKEDINRGKQVASKYMVQPH